MVLDTISTSVQVFMKDEKWYSRPEFGMAALF
jgi:hypothetical protein